MSSVVSSTLPARRRLIRETFAHSMNPILSMLPPGLPSHEVKACISIGAALTSLVITVVLRYRIQDWSAASSEGFRSARALAILSFVLALVILVRTVSLVAALGTAGNVSWMFEVFTPIIAVLSLASFGWIVASRFLARIGRTRTTPPTKANKTDAGNGSDGICRVSDASRSPSPDPGRSPEKWSLLCTI
jgi:hypothetical protein